jgi:hypothetical protein
VFLCFIQVSLPLWQDERTNSTYRLCRKVSCFEVQKLGYLKSQFKFEFFWVLMLCSIQLQHYPASQPRTTQIFPAVKTSNLQKSQLAWKQLLPILIVTPLMTNISVIVFPTFKRAYSFLVRLFSVVTLFRYCNRWCYQHRLSAQSFYKSSSQCLQRSPSFETK